MLASLDEPPVPSAAWCTSRNTTASGRWSTRPPASAAPHVAIYSRNGNEKTAQFPAIVEGAASRSAARLKGPVVLDGEIVAVDPAGRPLGFQHIQGRIHLTSPRRHRTRRSAPAGRRSSCSTCCATATTTCAACRSPRDGCACRSASSRAARSATCVRLSEIAADDGRPMLQRAQRRRLGRPHRQGRPVASITAAGGRRRGAR